MRNHDPLVLPTGLITGQVIAPICKTRQIKNSMRRSALSTYITTPMHLEPYQQVLRGGQEFAQVVSRKVEADAAAQTNQRNIA